MLQGLNHEGTTRTSMVNKKISITIYKLCAHTPIYNLPTPQLSCPYPTKIQWRIMLTNIHINNRKYGVSKLACQRSLLLYEESKWPKYSQKLLCTKANQVRLSSKLLFIPEAMFTRWIK